MLHLRSDRALGQQASVVARLVRTSRLLRSGFAYQKQFQNVTVSSYMLRRVRIYVHCCQTYLAPKEGAPTIKQVI